MDSNRIKRAVFPVFRFNLKDGSTEKELRTRQGDFLGSGFFTEIEDLVLFVTARHVVDVESTNAVIGIGDLVDNSKHTWDGFDLHPDVDLAFAVFSREKAPPFAAPLRFKAEALELGDDVFTFGYPFSGDKRVTEDGKTLVRIEPMAFKGYLTAEYSAEDLDGIVPRAFSSNYGLSFSCPAGLSGAPLLIHEAGEPTVVGVVYGSRSIEFQLDEYEELSKDGSIERHRLVKAHQIGLAAGVQELLQIARLRRNSPTT